MDLVRLGLVIRALRRRRGWRQVDLARAAGVSQSLVSLVERGHGDRIALRTLAAIAAALDARTVVDVRWRAGELDRLLDEDHAALATAMAGRLTADGWESRLEVTYADGRSTGAIDILAWHPATRTLLVIEIKTEVTSAEATLRKLDEKVRVAARVARDRFGWEARSVSRLLVIEDTTTARRRVARHAPLFTAAFPTRALGVRGWLGAPHGTIRGLIFLPPNNGGGRMSRRGGRHRVRSATRQEQAAPSNVDSRDSM